MDNYFDLYNLLVSFAPDPALVKTKFYELSRLYHPDRFAQANATAQAEALRMAALNNDAYKTLSKPDATMAYILRLNGLLEDEERYKLPPAFLMEMMDLNELLSEYEMNPADQDMKQQIAHSLENYLAEWEQEIRLLTKKYDAGEHTQELLLKIKDYYFRKKYLLRIQQRIDTFAAR